MKYKFRTFLTLITLYLMMQPSSAQKKALSINDLDSWPGVGVGDLTSDGKFCYYYSRILDNYEESWNALILKSTETNWSIEIPYAKGVKFADAHNVAVFKTRGDSLGIVTLGKNTVEYIPNVQTFDLIERFVVSKSKSAKDPLRIKDFISGKTTFLADVSRYYANKKTGKLLLLRNFGNSANLNSYNLFNNDSFELAKSIFIEELIFAPSGHEFVIKGSIQGNDGVWLYKASENNFSKLFNSNDISSTSKSSTFNLTGISNDAKKVYIITKEAKKENLAPVINSIVEIWNTKDQHIKTASPSPKEVLYIYNIDTKKLFSAQEPTEKVVAIGNSYILLKSTRVSKDKSEADDPNLHLVSTSDGKRQPLPFKSPLSFLSPDNKFILTYDTSSRNFFSYQIDQGILRNITEKINTNWTNDRDDHISNAYSVNTLAIKWITNDQYVLLHDNYDYWMVDPSNKTSPVNLSNGFGKQNNISLYFALSSSQSVLKLEDKILTSGFDIKTKENSFYEVTIGKTGNPALLYKGHFLIYAPYQGNVDQGMIPIKAKTQNAYLLKRMAASDSPNFFFTKDFKKFKSISEIYPEKEFNWLTSELINYDTYDGRTSQGILYKPENFDPNKKYALIIHFYEKLSDNLNLYKRPQYSEGAIDIPYLVSNEFLVFTPDIHFKKGNPGQSSYNSVVSAAEYLSKLPFVDGSKIGIQGHSFGGYQVNYLISQTDVFAAACAAAGVSDLISNYGSINDDGISKQDYFETGQYRVGSTLWANKEIYYNSTPILYADKIKTPLLLMNNRKDNSVSFSQGAEYFAALRRLNKPAWLLQYHNEGHILNTEAATKDFTVRMSDFFDTFLKGKTMPDWMKEK